MLTRREVLTGTAAASIAAIASARGVAAAGEGLALGNLKGGALGSFYKHPDAFAVFLKFDEIGAEVVYKEAPDGLDVFWKIFFKGWSPVSSISLTMPGGLAGAEASFAKIDAHGAEFLIKRDGFEVFSKVDSEGVTAEVLEDD